MTPLTFVVPGPLEQITGGYLFDRRVVEGLRAAGRDVTVHELPGEFPDCDATARNAAVRFLTTLPDDAVAVIDGLALPAFAECLTAEAAARLRLIGFVHHTLATEHGVHAAATQHLAGLEQRLLPRLRGVLCPSQVTAWGVEEYGLPRERIAVTPPGTERPGALPRHARSGGSPHLLCVAALTPRKGHLTLIEALAELGDRAWRLTCIGSLTRDVATASAVESAIARHGLGPRVLLAGEWPPSRLGAAYGEADLFVLPSFHEGYGMAFAEALAHGLPIIGTTGGAIPETVPAEAAMLVPPGDEEALAGALRLVLDQPELRERLAQGAARAGAALPDWPQALQRWIEALDRLVG